MILRSRVLLALTLITKKKSFVITHKPFPIKKMININIDIIIRGTDAMYLVYHQVPGNLFVATYSLDLDG